MTARRHYNDTRPTAEYERGDTLIPPCDEEPDLFFAPGNGWSTAPEQAEQAKAVCRTCPMLDACLKWALDTEEPHAIAGGMTPDERNELLGINTHSDVCGTYPTGYNRHRRKGEKPCDACRQAYNVGSRRRANNRKHAA